MSHPTNAAIQSLMDVLARHKSRPVWTLLPSQDGKERWVWHMIPLDAPLPEGYVENPEVTP
jgi:hypothetical protein